MNASHRDAEGGGDFRSRKPLKAAQCDDAAVLEAEFGQRGFQTSRRFTRPEVASLSGYRGVFDQGFTPNLPLLAGFLAGRTFPPSTQGDPVDPGPKSRTSIESGKSEEDLDETLLHGIV